MLRELGEGGKRKDTYNDARDGQGWPGMAVGTVSTFSPRTERGYGLGGEWAGWKKRFPVAPMFLTSSGQR